MPQPKRDEIAAAAEDRYRDQQRCHTRYTDRIGSTQYNRKLSERRAAAGKNYLTGKGVAENRLDAQCRGEAKVRTGKKRSALIKCLEPNRRVDAEHITIERRVQ